MELLVDKEINETFCQLLKKALDILIEKKKCYFEHKNLFYIVDFNKWSLTKIFVCECVGSNTHSLIKTRPKAQSVLKHERYKDEHEV